MNVVALFPLPCFCGSPTARRPAGRKVPSDDTRRLAADALHWWNWLDGIWNHAQGRGGSWGGKRSMHGQVIARALDLSAVWVARRQEARDSPDAPCHTYAAALHRLLKGREPYDGTDAPNNLAPGSLPRISMPNEVWSSPNLADVAPPDCAPFLRGDHERILRPQAERDNHADQALH